MPPKLFINNKFNVWNLPVKAKVLLISNINQAIAGPECLYNLCSIYGDVLTVRILAHKPDCALVEFTSASFAHIARENLDNMEVKGNKMVVSFSRYDTIKLPEVPDDNIKEFGNEEYVKLRRYKSEELKSSNMKKIVAPSATLHVGNCPPEFSPNDLKDIFIESGLKVTDVIGIAKRTVTRKKETDNPSRMFCYIEFADVDEALLGLAQVANSNGIRLTFSKDTIEKIKKGYEEKSIPLVEGDDVPPLAPLVEKKVEVVVEEKKPEEDKPEEAESESTQEAEEGVSEGSGSAGNPLLDAIVDSPKRMEDENDE